MKMIEQIMFHSLTPLPILTSLLPDQNNCSFFLAAMQLPASVVSAGARREGSTQLFLRVLTLDMALDFLHGGVFISQVLLNQLEDALWVFALSLIECQQAASSGIFAAEMQRHVPTTHLLTNEYSEWGPFFWQVTLNILWRQWKMLTFRKSFIFSDLYFFNVWGSIEILVVWGSWASLKQFLHLKLRVYSITSPYLGTGVYLCR